MDITFRILSYAVWMRWGRVGYKGQNSWTTSGSDLDAAKSVFTRKFQVNISGVFSKKNVA